MLPTEMGEPRPHPALDQLARAEVLDKGVARAVSLGVAVWTGGRWEVEVGSAGQAGRSAADEATVFDLASVSKSFVAATFARLLEQRVVTADSRLADLIPELRGTRAAGATLEALLSHRAGLRAHVKLYAPLEGMRSIERREALRAAANALHTDSADTAFPPLYSDLGYLLAGEALARSASLPLDELVGREVSEPLGITARSARQWLRAPEKNFLARIAPTEHVEFRGGELAGVVHDENAWAFAGHGLSGQAGLFATVRDVLAFGMALLDARANRQSNWLSAATMQKLLAERPGGTLRVGFDGKSAGLSAAGPSASALTFGHLGFTGTSFWCDPTADAVGVLLTNRVCPTRENVAIRSCRPLVHEALFAFAESTRRAVLARPLSKGLVGNYQA
jgi:CubicO group peptidase (beta-lactamase class C family)